MQGKIGLVRATTGMAFATLCSRFSGLARDKVLAAFLGPTGLGDAYTVGFRAPNLFRQLLAEGALHATFIPTLAELEKNEDKAKIKAFVGAMFSTLSVVLTGIVVLGMVAAKPLAMALAPAYRDDPEKFRLTVYFTRQLFPYLGLVSLAALFQGVLNVSRRFLLSASTPIALNAAIAFSVLFAHYQGYDLPPWLVVGVLVGGALQFLLQWVHCWRLGLPVAPGKGAFFHPEVRTVLKKAGPLLLSAGIYPLMVFLSTNFAAGAGEGAVFCLYVASRVNELVYGVVVVQLFTALLPTLALDNDRQETLGFAIRFQSVMVFPSMFFLLALPKEVAGLLFGGGKFQPWAVEITGSVLVLLALGMPALALGKLVGGAFFANHETRIPMMGSVIMLVTFTASGLTLVKWLGVEGVALSLSIANYVSALWLWTALKKRGCAPSGQVFFWVRRHALAAAAMAALLSVGSKVIRVPYATTLTTALFVGGMGLVGLGVYLVVAYTLGAPEVQEVRKALRGTGL